MLATSLALAALWASAPAGGAGDVVLLKDGTKVEGRVVRDTPKQLVVRVGSRDRELAPADVAEVRSVARSLREALARWDQMRSDDAPALVELARFCEGRGLSGERELLALGALAVDPSNAAAHELLGHERRGEKWVVRDGARTLAFDKLLEARKGWGDGWHLTTTHYDIRTNVAPAQAVAAALELELCYRTFFDWLGEEVELYEVVEPMQAQLHADRRSFPGSDDRRGFFDPALDTLFVDASNGLELGALAHEATHQLLHDTAVRTRAGRGEVPPWLDEGLAEYVKWSRVGEGGHARYSRGERAAPHFKAHAEARKPYDLSRVLAFGTEDFTFSSHLALTYAQAYTLLHFCLHGDVPAYRAGFFEFLRRCYLGKASMTDFKDALGIDKERGFEQAWLAYVKRGG